MINKERKRILGIGVMGDKMPYISESGHDPYAIHVNIANEFLPIVQKNQLASGDLFVIEDSEDNEAKKKIQFSAINIDTIADGETYKKYTEVERIKLTGIEVGADVTDVQNVTIAENSIDVNEHQNLNSTGFQIDSAVSLKHTQGTDTTLGTQTENLDMGNFRVMYAADPLVATDLATKNYVDTQAPGADAFHKNIGGEIYALPIKNTPVNDDVLLIEDSESTIQLWAKKKIQLSSLFNSTHDPQAIHKNVGGEFDSILPARPLTGTERFILEIDAIPGDDARKAKLLVANLHYPHMDDNAFHYDIQYEINSLPTKVPAVEDTDILMIESLTHGGSKYKISVSDLYDHESHDPKAIHYDGIGEFDTITEETSVASDDYFIIEKGSSDSQTEGEKRKVRFDSIPTDHDPNALHVNPGAYDEINQLSSKSTGLDNDYLILEQYNQNTASARTHRKVRISDLPTGGGGEVNYLLYQGSVLGKSIVGTKEGAGLGVKGLINASDYLTLSVDSNNNITFDIDEDYLFARVKTINVGQFDGTIADLANGPVEPPYIDLLKYKEVSRKSNHVVWDASALWTTVNGAAVLAGLGTLSDLVVQVDGLEGLVGDVIENVATLAEKVTTDGERIDDLEAEAVQVLLPAGHGVHFLDKTGSDLTEYALTAFAELPQNYWAMISIDIPNEPVNAHQLFVPPLKYIDDEANEYSILNIPLVEVTKYLNAPLVNDIVVSTIGTQLSTVLPLIYPKLKDNPHQLMQTLIYNKSPLGQYFINPIVYYLRCKEDEGDQTVISLIDNESIEIDINNVQNQPQKKETYLTIPFKPMWCQQLVGFHKHNISIDHVPTNVLLPYFNIAFQHPTPPFGYFKPLWEVANDSRIGTPSKQVLLHKPFGFYTPPYFKDEKMFFWSIWSESPTDRTANIHQEDQIFKDSYESSLDYVMYPLAITCGKEDALGFWEKGLFNIIETKYKGTGTNDDLATFQIKWLGMPRSKKLRNKTLQLGEKLLGELPLGGLLIGAMQVVKSLFDEEEKLLIKSKEEIKGHSSTPLLTFLSTTFYDDGWNPDGTGYDMGYDGRWRYIMTENPTSDEIVQPYLTEHEAPNDTITLKVNPENITYLGTQVQDLNMGSNFITNVATPTTSPADLNKVATVEFVNTQLAPLIEKAHFPDHDDGTDPLDENLDLGGDETSWNPEAIPGIVIPHKVVNQADADWATGTDGVNMNTLIAYVNAHGGGTGWSWSPVTINDTTGFLVLSDADYYKAFKLSSTQNILQITLPEVKTLTAGMLLSFYNYNVSQHINLVDYETSSLIDIIYPGNAVILLQDGTQGWSAVSDRNVVFSNLPILDSTIITNDVNSFVRSMQIQYPMADSNCQVILRAVGGYTGAEAVFNLPDFVGTETESNILTDKSSESLKLCWFDKENQFSTQTQLKNTPISTDRILIEDSEDNFNKKYTLYPLSSNPIWSLKNFISSTGYLTLDQNDLGSLYLLDTTPTYGLGFMPLITSENAGKTISLVINNGEETFSFSGSQGSGQTIDKSGVSFILYKNSGVVTFVSDGVSNWIVMSAASMASDQTYFTGYHGDNGMPEYADNASAILGGLDTGSLYRTGDLLKVVH